MPAHKIHGMFGTPTYRSWESMKARCNNPKSPMYFRYGARGIKVCKRWSKFKNFLKDMGIRPSLKYSLDRIDGYRNYTPSNCRWATSSQQSRNRLHNTLLTAFGKTQCVADWADELRIRRDTIYQRLTYGFSHEKALTIGRIK